MAHKTRIDVGCDQLLYVILSTQEQRLHVWHRLRKKILEVLIDLHEYIIGQVYLRGRIDRYVVPVDVEHSLCNIVECMLIVVDLQAVSNS